MDFIMQNLSTILISLALLIIFSLIIYNEFHKRKKGKGGCSCGCSGCALSDTCHKNKKEVLENK